MDSLYYLSIIFACMLFTVFCVFSIDFLLGVFIKTFVSAVAYFFKCIGFDGWALFERLFSDKDYFFSYVVQCGRCEQKMRTRRNGIYSCPSCKLEFHWERGKEPYLVTSGELPDNIFSQAELGDVPAQYELAKNYYYGEGKSKNLLQAYKWANLAATRKNLPLLHLRHKIAGDILPSQLEVAQELVLKFVPKKSPKLVYVEKATVGGFLQFAIHFSAIFSLSFVFIAPYLILLYILPQSLVNSLDDVLTRLSPVLAIVFFQIVPKHYKEITTAAEMAVISRT